MIFLFTDLSLTQNEYVKEICDKLNMQIQYLILIEKKNYK